MNCCKLILEFFIGCIGSGKTTSTATRSKEIMDSGHDVIILDNIYKNSDGGWFSSNQNTEILVEDLVANSSKPTMYILITSDLFSEDEHEINGVKQLFLDYVESGGEIDLEEKYIYFGKDLDNCIFNTIFTSYFRSLRDLSVEDIIDYVTTSYNKYNPEKVDVEVYKFTINDVKKHLFNRLKYLSLLCLKDDREDQITREVATISYIIKKTKELFPNDTKDTNIK